MRKEELSLEEQVERIRRKRTSRYDTEKIRMVLNTLFLILAAVGLVMYFLDEEKHVTAWIVIAIGMMLKVVEFILRLF